MQVLGLSAGFSEDKMDDFPPDPCRRASGSEQEEFTTRDWQEQPDVAEQSRC